MFLVSIAIAMTLLDWYQGRTPAWAPYGAAAALGVALFATAPRRASCGVPSRPEGEGN